MKAKVTMDTFDLKKVDDERRIQRRSLTWYEIIKILKEDRVISIDFKGIKREKD
jgi:hypothetical protein